VSTASRLSADGTGATTGAGADADAGEVVSRFTVEDSFTAGAHVVQRWRYDWDGGHVRGVDIFTVRDGLVAGKLAYVKG
jgi:hypothetical protein